MLRILLGILALYTMLMTFLLFQPIGSARKYMSIFAKDLGKELPEKNYAEDCRVFTPENPVSFFFNIYDAIDIHFYAHLFGWWFKMLIIRDVKMAWICSISFELMEITFRHWLPNFYECWWDHLFFDLFGCNWLGIILGSYTC